MRRAPCPRYPPTVQIVFLDLSEQPHPRHVGRPLLLRMIVGQMAGLEDDGAQLRDAAATGVVEVHKRKAGPRSCVKSRLSTLFHRGFEPGRLLIDLGVLADDEEAGQQKHKRNRDQRRQRICEYQAIERKTIVIE